MFVTGEIRAEENAGGLTLGSFSARDPDHGDTHTFLLSHDDGDYFTLTTSGLLATAQGRLIFLLDFISISLHSVALYSSHSGQFQQDVLMNRRIGILNKIKQLHEYTSIQYLAYFKYFVLNGKFSMGNLVVFPEENRLR